MTVITETLLPRMSELLKEHLVGVLLASLVWLFLTVTAVMIAILSPYVVLLPALAILGAFGGEEPSALATLAAITPAMLLYLVVFGATVLVLIPAISGSVYRAFDDAIAGRAPLRWSAPISSLRTNLRQVVLTNLLVTVLVFVGLLLLVVPGLVVAFLTMFALPAAAVDGLAPVDAIRRSVERVRSDIGGHVLLMLGAWIIGMVCGLLPFVGSGLGGLLVLLWFLLAWRAPQLG